MNLADIHERNAHHRPDDLAILFEGRRLTHAGLLDRARRLAGVLAAEGLHPGDRVAILARNRMEVMEAFAACDIAGFVAVPLNHRLAEPELLQVCADAGPALLLAARDMLATGRRLAEGTALLRVVVDLDEAGPQGYATRLAAAPPQPPAYRPRPQDAAMIVYTSGSTGRAKGVVHTHASLLADALRVSHEGGAQPTDLALIVMPLFHIGGRIVSMYYWVLGAGILLMPAFEEEAVLRALAEERATAAHLAPVMIQRLLDHSALGRHDLPALRSVIYASAPMPVPLLRRAVTRFGPIFTQVYGSTEGLSCTLLKPHEHVLDGTPEEVARLGAAGHPPIGCDIRVVRDDGSDCADGEVGEVLFRGPGVMAGYWRNEEATRDALRDGWLHTGDMGRLDARGFLFIVDRKKDMIISGGENIYSWEVEEALRTHPAVAEAAVVAVPDAQWGEAVKAFVVLHPGAAAGEAALVEHVRTRIAGYKKPRSIEFLPALPRQHHGKVDKRALREPFWTGHSRRVS